MELSDSPPRPQTRRKPLGDGLQQANTSFRPPSSVKSKRMVSSHTSSGLPHHESLDPNGHFTVSSVTNSPDNKRLSALTNEDSESKRNSQLSTTSTTASGKGRRKKTHIGPWELGGDIGRGGIGRVRKVRHRVTGQQAAVKIIKKAIAENARAESLANLAESSVRSSLPAFDKVMPFGIEREVIIMKLLEHPNVVELYDVWENQGELYLIMEYVNGGELFDYIREHEYLEEDESVYLFRQMLAALLHCHRLGIHHRDLKPENILLDRDTCNVKLADFGMAALQPKGRHLTTPCGSLHYAAPEVFGRHYDGSKIDVWSLGVILFVMLTGTTPFDYVPERYEGNIAEWAEVLRKGIFDIPDELSKEAKDLLTKMLRPEPHKRISLEGAWHHPLVHKYAKLWGEPSGSGKLENWIGATPLIKEWKVKGRNDIDREIFRNLRTLWHSEKEDVLIERLVSPDANHEKYFYYALAKHRDDQLEDYSAFPDTLAYSMSDYHHLKRPGRTSDVPPVPKAKLSTRTKSQFSILNDEHLQSKSSMLEPPPSEQSYDPYRVSRNGLGVAPDNSTSITVHRGTSKHKRDPSRGQSPRHLGSLRVEALKKEQHRVSTVSSSASLRPSSTSARRKTGAGRRSMSYSSFASSHVPSSPPVVTKPSIKHKRAVNFSHLRKSSTASALDSTRSDNDLQTTLRKSQSKTKGTGPDIRDPLSSPALYADTAVRSRKETRNSGLVVDKEARKVSTELEKYCEEAFNRSSQSSSHRTSAATSHTPYDTPPSSVSNRASVHSSHALATPPSSKRPLPEVPSETPNTYAAREIAETRNRLAARYAADPGANSQTYTEVLAHLDALLKQPVSSSELTKRTVSLPEPKYSSFFTELPAISEEGKLQDTQAQGFMKDTADVDAGAVERHRTGAQSKTREQDPATTIRMVEPSSPHRPAPLNIRKVSSATTATNPRAVNGHVDPPKFGNRLLSHSTGRFTSPNSPTHLQMFAEHNVIASPPPAEEATQKKRAWWRRNKTPETGPIKISSPRRWEDLDDRTRSPASADLERKSRRGSDHSNKDNFMSGALPPATSPVPGKRPGFLKFFKRTPKSYVDENFRARYEEMREPGTPSTQTAFSSSDGSNRTARPGHKNRALEDSDRTDPRDLGVQQHWIARFLHIKPLVRMLVFQTTRGRARGEIVRLLDNWRVHGLKDVIVDKPRNLVFGKLGPVNALGLKEVEFVIELFVVLEKGRRKGLSIARWTQRTGAGSSFKRVVQEVEARFDNKGLLVKDKSMKKEIETLLAESS